ncbi:MAG TPA: S-layer homology domain-containing protein [Thermoanaerobaculia bacterium]|nr:S-layer homology domain-containing protein [Thermoanaerobaculia bacterium]
MRLSRSSRIHAGFLASALAAIALLTVSTARADTCTWTGGTSAWKTTSNWTGCSTAPNYPDTGDTVIIGATSHDPVIGAADTIGLSGLTITGATLTVQGTFTPTGTSTGTGNVTIASGGVLNLNNGSWTGTGNLTISSGATCIVGGGFTLMRPYINAGTTTINSSGYFSLGSGGSITNTGTVDIQNDQGIYGSGQLFQNNSPGVLKRSVSAGLAFIQPTLNGNGAVNVTTGTLRLDGGGTYSGTFTFTGTTLEFNGGTWAITADFSGGSGGNLYLYNGTAATFNSGASFSVSTITIGYGTWTFNTGTTVTPTNWAITGGGTLTGSDAFALQSGGTFTWGSGTMSGTGTTTIGSGRTLLLNNSGVTLQRKLSNAGAATMSSNAYVSISTGGSIDNSGTWEIQNDSGIYGSGQIINNTGTISRTTSAGTAFIQANINGAGGTVNVNSGTLQLSGGGNNSNNFNFAGATLQFNGGTWAMTGAFKGDTGGNLLLSAATITFGSGASFSPLSQLTVSGGTNTFNSGSTLAPSNITFSGGTLQGSDSMGVASGGIFTWTGGTMAGTGTTTIDTGRQLIMNGSGFTLQRPFVNKGTATQSGNAYMYISTGGTLNNQGTWEAQNDQYINGSGSVFTNSGTFKRTTSAGTYYFYVNTSNSGTFDVQTGDLNFSGTYTQTAGALFLDGGNIDSPSYALNIQGGVVKGNGNINGDVSVSGTGQASPGNSPGEIAITNNHKYTQAAPGVYAVDINGTSAGNDYDDMLISGAATLGGELRVSLGYTPAVGDSFTILQHASRTGTFGTLTFPSPGAGLGWDLSYSATATTLTIAQLKAAFLKVDTAPSSGTSNMNGVLEPGETVVIDPNWLNMTDSAIAATGTASTPAGPTGATYTLPDTSADFGTVNANSTGDCLASTANCYQFAVSAPAVRPAAHWDASFKETVTGGVNKTWLVHIGESFLDVPTTQQFYKPIETMLHTGITGGCTDARHYCPSDQVNRSSMAIFIAKGIAGGGANVPVSGQVSGIDYNCTAGGSSIFTDVKPTDSFCKHVHYIAAQNVTQGCTATTYCPSTAVDRGSMAIFIAKAIVAPDGGNAIPKVYGPDPVTGFSYNCNSFGTNIHFSDVKYTDTFCKHVMYLWARGIVAGVSPTTYQPATIVTRDQMAKFLTNAFNLLLYGPQN